MKPIAALAFAVCVLPAFPALGDELRERQLQSKVNQLEREINTLERRIEQLERAAATRGGTVTPKFQARPEPDSPAWLSSANWDRIKPGMAVSDVIAVLGRPTSTRDGEGTQIQLLMYAMEIGPESVLAGSIAFGADGVTEVRRPQLR